MNDGVCGVGIAFRYGNSCYKYALTLANHITHTGLKWQRSD
jgi:hypothetical protein